MAFITRLLKSSKTLIVPLLLAVSLNAAGEGISATRAEAKLTHAGQLSVSSRFRTDLPDQTGRPPAFQFKLAAVGAVRGVL